MTEPDLESQVFQAKVVAVCLVGAACVLAICWAIAAVGP